MPSTDEGGISVLLSSALVPGYLSCGSCRADMYMEVRVLCSQSRLTLMTPWTVACQAPLSKGILQARILKWVAMPSSRGSSQSRDQTQVSHIAGIFFTS